MCLIRAHLENIIVPAFLIAMALGILVLGIYSFYHYIRLEIIEVYFPMLKLTRDLSRSQKAILDKHFPYYKNLTMLQKRQFEKRLRYFIEEKEFIYRGIGEITEEMKVLIGASAVQLTFGYKPLKFPHFSKIVLFPGRFYSKGSDKLKKGEVNPRGMIVLSWQDFIRDYRMPHDGVNLGLHEMAHALKIEDHTSGGEYAFLNEDELNTFYQIARGEYMKIRKGEKSFIRSYGGTNMEEFFAVAIEQFFEQPHEFKDKLPLLYASLSRLLNQDLARGISPFKS